MIRQASTWSLAGAAVWGLALASAAPAAQPAARDDAKALRAMVEADWAAQEKRLKRSPQSPEAVRDALKRARLLLADLRKMPDPPDVRAEADELERLAARAGKTESLTEPERLALYRRIRWRARRAALKNPLFAGRPIVFLKRRRFICQMLHEYLGYYYKDLDGGGVYLLPRPGKSLAVRDLVRGRLPRGSYTTLSLSYDAKTVYFAFCRRDARQPAYASGEWFLTGRDAARKAGDAAGPWRCFHLYAMGADGGDLRQLTSGPDDDFDPCPLPDGGLAFMSTRRGGYCRCNNPWEPLPAYTLHRMDADGRDIRTLSFHETNEWHPSVLHDGRIVYIRWDYVDRSAANFHGLWVANPDGSNPSILFGNYTMRINACYQPRAIPGSRRVAFLAGAHHADVGGVIVTVDPDRARHDSASGQDALDAVEVITPGMVFPEAAGWPGSYFHSPWPLSESYFLAGFGYDPPPGMSSGNRRRDRAGLYYVDRFGNLELLYRDPEIACMYPVPLAPRPVPPIVPGELDPTLGDEGELMLSDVTRGHFPLPADRPIRKLRIFQVLPKATTHIVNRPRLGHANAESARLLLGTVPVEADGSAYFRVPARKPVYFQAVDAAGRAVQSMRSITYLQPGERRGCVGCHEPRGAAPTTRPPRALRRGPSRIEPGPDGTNPFSYPRLIQPILDRHCVRCHDGKPGAGKGKLVLTGEPAGPFSRSYRALRPYVRWYEWGGATITPIITRPGRIGADASRLPVVLAAHERAGRAKLSAADRRRILIWLDGNVPFYGTYAPAARQAQQRGQAVPTPKLQ